MDWRSHSEVKVPHPLLCSLDGLWPTDAVAKKEYCSVEVSEAKYKAFVYAIRNHYWYQMYIGEGFSCLL